MTTEATRRSVEGQLVYAIGDIHGRYDLLERLLRQIAADAAARAVGRRPILVFCGDYVDRGPDAAKVLAALGWLRGRADYEVRLLLGNHEQAMLRFIADPDDGRDWLGFGGAATVRAYGIEPPDVDVDAVVLVTMRDSLLDAMPASHLYLVQSLETLLTIGDYAFCHAGVRPGRKLADQSLDDLLWIRAPFLEWAKPFEKVIVHGHTWTSDEPTIGGSRIGIDTGAYETGVLTAVRLEDGELAIIQARGAAVPTLYTD